MAIYKLTSRSPRYGDRDRAYHVVELLAMTCEFREFSKPLGLTQMIELFNLKSLVFIIGGSMDYTPYHQYLELKLSPQRYQHCLGVVREMLHVATQYKLDRVFANLAGLLHDVAKEIPLEVQIRWLEAYDPENLKHNQSCLHETYTHGPVGALLVSQALGRKEPAVLEAIRCHAGNYDAADGMFTYSRCLHVADLLAPIKDYAGRRKLQKMFRAGNLDGAELLAGVWVVEHFNQIDVPVHPAYAKKIARLTKLINPPPSFFHRLDP